jgi:tripartite-type tricarboxylate transporter receptor subunit TctC
MHRLDEIDRARRRAWVRLLGLGALSAVGLASPGVHGSSGDRRPIRILVLEPGGQSDIAARLFEPALERALGRDLVIENRGGAGGRIAARLVAQAAPDGLTLGVGGANNLVLAGLLKRDIGYDPARDLSLIAPLLRVPFAVGVRPALGISTLKDLVWLAAEKPGQVTYGTASIGGSSHLTMAAIEQFHRVSLLHVPFRGSTVALNELAAGRIDVVATDLSQLVPLVQADKLRVIAVTGGRRARAMPDVPSLSEQGMAGFRLEPWYGMYGPAGLPAAFADRLRVAIAEAVRSAEVLRQAEFRGFELLPPTEEALRALVNSDRALFGPLVEKLGLDKLN